MEPQAMRPFGICPARHQWSGSGAKFRKQKRAGFGQEHSARKAMGLSGTVATIERTAGFSSRSGKPSLSGWNWIISAASGIA